MRKRTFRGHSPALLLLVRGELAEVLLSLSTSVKMSCIDLNVVSGRMEVIVDVELPLGVFFVRATRKGHATKDEPLTVVRGLGKVGEMGGHGVEAMWMLDG